MKPTVITGSYMSHGGNGRTSAAPDAVYGNYRTGGTGGPTFHAEKLVPELTGIGMLWGP